MKRYFAKPDTWFDVGTEAFLLGDVWDDNIYYRDTEMIEPKLLAMFAGTRNGKPDEEPCDLDDFEISDL